MVNKINTGLRSRHQSSKIKVASDVDQTSDKNKRERNKRHHDSKSSSSKHSHTSSNKNATRGGSVSSDKRNLANNKKDSGLSPKFLNEVGAELLESRSDSELVVTDVDNRRTEQRGWREGTETKQGRRPSESSGFLTQFLGEFDAEYYVHGQNEEEGVKDMDNRPAVIIGEAPVELTPNDRLVIMSTKGGTRRGKKKQEIELSKTRTTSMQSKSEDKSALKTKEKPKKHLATTIRNKSHGQTRNSFLEHKKQYSNKDQTNPGVHFWTHPDPPRSSGEAKGSSISSKNSVQQKSVATRKIRNTTATLQPETHPASLSEVDSEEVLFSLDDVSSGQPTLAQTLATTGYSSLDSKFNPSTKGSKQRSSPSGPELHEDGEDKTESPVADKSSWLAMNWNTIASFFSNDQQLQERNERSISEQPSRIAELFKVGGQESSALVQTERQNQSKEKGQALEAQRMLMDTLDNEMQYHQERLMKLRKEKAKLAQKVAFGNVNSSQPNE